MKRLFSTLVLSLLVVAAALAKQPLRVLAIGNSFSEDAIEQNLHEIAAADGQEIIIVNLYYPGCSLERHANNVAGDIADYRYRRIGLDGNTTEIAKVKLSQVIGEEQWDYVSVQQASHYSGLWETYQPYLDQLVAWVRAHVPATTRILFHGTWAYSLTARHDGYANYDRLQSTMYRAIIDCTRQAVKRVDGLIPNGTAVQNARTSSMGDTWNRDGYHLQLQWGRLLAALTWWEVISGNNVERNTYLPAGVTAQQAAIARRAAHQAVKHPWRVTPVRL